LTPSSSEVDALASFASEGVINDGEAAVARRALGRDVELEDR
jgi:hypothetical protein